MTTLALFSNKGGVGKTASAVNLAYLAARSGRSTLICDLDPQGSTTFYLRVKPKLKPKARGLLKWRKEIDLPISAIAISIFVLPVRSAAPGGWPWYSNPCRKSMT
jgi:cellulose biosynthesis protein BcsQ